LLAGVLESTLAETRLLVPVPSGAFSTVTPSGSLNDPTPLPPPALPGLVGADPALDTVTPPLAVGATPADTPAFDALAPVAGFGGALTELPHAASAIGNTTASASRLE
jgi:hypothetical protein